MADLRAGAVSAVKKLAVHNNTAAYAGAKGNENHVFTAHAAAHPEFAQGGHVGVVACLNRQAGQAGEYVLNIEDAPA